MTKGKFILGTITGILTLGTVFAFHNFSLDSEKKSTSGGKRLYTTSIVNGCRVVLCWTCDGCTISHPCPTAVYYTTRTTGGRCINIYTKGKTTTN